MSTASIPSGSTEPSQPATTAAPTPAVRESQDGGRADPWLRRALAATADLWWGSRLAVLILSMVGARALSGGPADAVPGLHTLWNRWDVGLYTKVARFGYLSPKYTDHTEVDFPGLPLAMRLVHLVVRDWIISGLVVSALAGAVASAAIWRLAADEVGERRARVAVVTLILFPYAVYLFSGYSEAIFLGFATASWVSARRGRWWLAGLLGAGAASTRVTGIPLAFGLAVEYVMARRRAGLPVLARPAFALALPPLPVLGFVVYLHQRTGHWDAYTRGEKAGWHRSTAWPWVGWRTTWHAAFDGAQSSQFVWFWRGELVAVVVGVLLTVVLLRGRRWGEAAFVGAASVLISAQAYYASGIRTILVAFPLYLMLARAAQRWRWVVPAYLWVSAPVMAVLVVAFTQGAWVD